MLNMTLDQYEYSVVDYGRPTNLKLYEEDKATLFTGTGYDGVIQGFKRRNDGTFYWWNDVTRGLAVSGIGAQVVSNIDISFSIGNNTGTFAFTKSNLPSIPGYLWLKAVLFKGGTGLSDATEVVSSDFVRVWIVMGRT